MPELLITAITASPRMPSRAVLRAQGRVLGSLPLRVIAELGIAPGSLLDPAMACRLENAIAFDKALARAMKMLNRQALSRAALEAKLAARGVAQELLPAVLERLQEIGAIDDQALAKELADQLGHRQAAGPNLIRHKLTQRGIDENTTEALAQQSGQPAQQLAAARQLLAAQRQKIAHLPPDKQLRRLSGILARRGFDQDVVAQVLEESGLLES